MDIEIVVVPDCPNEAPAAELLRRALDDAGLNGTDFTTRTVTDRAEAELTGFTGSPTILIDGRDPFAEPGRPAGLACRVYATRGGLSGLPDPDRLREALAAAAHTRPRH